MNWRAITVWVEYKRFGGQLDIGRVGQSSGLLMLLETKVMAELTKIKLVSLI
jgi:hypothetical protein